MPEITPALLAAFAAMVSLNAYAVLGGADFGGGVWDLLARGPRAGRQRELITHAMGPVWEANHVWLILVVVLLFTCFPPAFSRLAIVLHIPLTLMLIGIVARGAAFTFRSYDTSGDHAQRRWGRIFAVASLVTPLLLGTMIGALAAGRVMVPEWEAGPVPDFTTTFVAPWTTPFAAAIGVLALLLFAMLAAVFLTVEASDPELAEDFRRRGLAAGAGVFLASGVALLLAASDEWGAPLMWRGLTQASWALGFHLVTGASAVTALAALWRRRYRLARVAVVLQVSCILWGWAIAQYPYLVPPDLAIERAAAPAVTLRLVLVTLLAGAAVLLPSLYYLFRVFKSRTSSA